MARGRFWQAFYDPEGSDPVAVAHFDVMDGTPGFVDRRIENLDGQTEVKVRWTQTSLDRHFQKCDIAAKVVDSQISNCTFTECRFRGSVWTGVKFSNCRFERCDFSDSKFFRCVFVQSCRFVDITASPELFRIEETEISAKAFMSALKPNLNYLPDDVLPEYQIWRFKTTKKKVAKALYGSTKNEADLEYYFEAYEQLMRAHLITSIERYRYNDKEILQPRFIYYLYSCPARLEKFFVLSSGALTSWGRSILKAALFVLCVFCMFAVAYACLTVDAIDANGDAIPRAHRLIEGALESLNITLVAGYTAYYESNATILVKLVQSVNVILGIFWYSLIVPVLTRRILG